RDRRLVLLLRPSRKLMHDAVAHARAPFARHSTNPARQLSQARAPRDRASTRSEGPGTRHLFARREEDVVPRGRVLPVPDTEPLDAPHPSALTVPFVIAAREFRGVLLRIVGAGQDPPSVRGDTGELP